MSQSTQSVKQTLLFDLDDTLIHCNKYFDIVIAEYLKLMSRWFDAYRVEQQEILTIQSRFDLEGVSANGFVSTHFPQSLVKCYTFLCEQTGRTYSQDEYEILWKLGLSVYEIEVEPYPGMLDTLNRLRDEGHELHLYTGGETVIQQRKIEQMKLSTYFDDRIFIRQHKTTEALSSILNQLETDPLQTWMIGNSLRTDVIPALTNGINSVYLKQNNEWAYNLVEVTIEPKGAFYTIDRLTAVPDVIQQWCAQREARVL
ncbi:HAD family hydrolase [Paenibacillus sp. SC116]|uniref:HAD family hydrolase n=1 Tax=Paenibacillus sp. SC116 TaxID=2968986 RepID=UPI00215A3C24|nr:HAD family hydrolase [Paenibacillus sp. SC116]MCR8842775.1 HAD family hydrolase [Paenibacillus sp. SC116]